MVGCLQTVTLSHLFGLSAEVLYAAMIFLSQRLLQAIKNARFLLCRSSACFRRRSSPRRSGKQACSLMRKLLEAIVKDHVPACNRFSPMLFLAPLSAPHGASTKLFPHGVLVRTNESLKGGANSWENTALWCVK